MLDRASTFAQPEIVQLLQTRFVPVAIDQAYQRRQKDTEGDFYRKIAGQSPRNDFNNTTQGFYIATAGGDLLLYNNNRDPEKLLRLMKQKLGEYETSAEEAQEIDAAKIDRRYNPEPPEEGLIVRVQAKILDGYEPTDNRWQRIFQTAMSRDNLWITGDEHRSLVAGKVPELLAKRIARYHLVDNTRGEPPMWRPDEIRDVDIRIEQGWIRGTVTLRSKNGDRGYEAELLGEIEIDSGKVVRLDMVCLGSFYGEGRFTGGAPEGKFPLGISFTLADGTDLADGVPPQGSRGWIDGYLKMR